MYFLVFFKTNRTKSIFVVHILVYHGFLEFIYSLFSLKSFGLYRNLLGDREMCKCVKHAKNSLQTKLSSTSIDFLKNKITPPDAKIDVLKDDLDEFAVSSLYMGYLFEKEIKEKNYNNEVNEIREMCKDFIKELIIQLRERLPDNFEPLEKLQVFAAENVLKHNKNHNDLISILEHFNYKNIDGVLAQYGKIQLVPWQSTDDTIQFWSEVLTYKDAGKNKPFEEIALFAIGILSLPWSNAAIERPHQMNIVKTKLRNKMTVKSLNSILNIIYGLRRHGKCCHNYQLPEKYLNLIRSSDKYTDSSNCELDEIITQLEMYISMCCFIFSLFFSLFFTIFSLF
ncbi:uncharacterized protein LOC117195307 [Drosophila miranda]|uniref:uncharacterized protein LOC117195307 n=1 Tax=Drosophila miranda TaxID=7229 RepID=UPI00143F1D55|nr:uncharacterized protein LOC117195307 [Drosophila miranda]